MEKLYHVYADANIYLDFFRFSQDDLAQLEKFIAHISGSGVEVYLPQLTLEEYSRNRDKVISDQITAIQRMSLTMGVPTCARDLSTAKQFTEKLKAAADARTELLNEVETLAAQHSFKADSLISSLFQSATKIPTTEDLITRARLRSELGNPPGKPAKLGDRLNWESLLATVPTGKDLHIITRDEDYLANFKAPTANQFLISEWFSQKSGNLLVYSSIKSFATHVDSTIVFAATSKRQDAIEELAASTNYAATHNAIGKLVDFWGQFTSNECETLLKIAMDNAQVGGIISDADVHDFYHHIRNKLPWSGNETADTFDEHWDDFADVPF